MKIAFPRTLMPLIIVGITMACVGAAQHRDRQPSIQPASNIVLSTTRPVEGPIRRTASVVAESLIDHDHELTFTDKITRSSSVTIYFGQLDLIDHEDADEEKVANTAPIVAWKEGSDVRAVKLDDDRLVGAAWSYVGSGPGREEIWGVLDASLDDTQPGVVFAHSLDGGETWLLTSIEKPDRRAKFDSICLGPDGKGRLTVYLSAPAKSRRARQAGYYHFRTIDGGKTWSAPEHEIDALHQSETVDPDSTEQIDAPAGPVQRASLNKSSAVAVH